MNLYALALLAATVSVAQHQQGNVANVPDQKFDTAKHCICLIDGHGCKAPESDTKAACEGVGGTWVMPLVVPGPISSDFASVSVGDLVSVGDVTVSKDFHQSADVDSQTGRVVKLSDEEYAHLQKLRQAVADEEKKIAVTHGVLLVPKLIHAGTNTCLATSYIIPSCDTDQYQSADRWQFRGQWLFINIPKAAQTEVK